MADNATHFSDPLTMQLAEIGPKPSPLRGEPVESIKVLFEDAFIETGVWECTAGCFPSRRDGYRETITIIKGNGMLRDADGTEHPLAPGVALAIPEGWVGEWDLTDTVRKVYTASYTEPRS